MERDFQYSDLTSDSANIPGLQIRQVCVIKEFCCRVTALLLLQHLTFVPVNPKQEKNSPFFAKALLFSKPLHSKFFPTFCLSSRKDRRPADVQHNKVTGTDVNGCLTHVRLWSVHITIDGLTAALSTQLGGTCIMLCNNC